MNTFELLEGRHHVRKYSDKVPPKEQIESALWKAWKTTPTKNNAMPYKIFVYGPDKKEEKEKVWKMVYKNHKVAERRAVARGQGKTTEGGFANPYYEHIKYNPYLLTIHAQPREPNEFYRKQVERGMFFDQAWPERVDNFIDTSAVEVGLFIQILTLYLLEYKIDLSYTSCFVRDAKQWRANGLKHVEYRPIVLMSMGYSEVFRKDVIEKYGRTHEDIKPAMSEMIEWI